MQRLDIPIEDLFCQKIATLLTIWMQTFAGKTNGKKGRNRLF